MRVFINHVKRFQLADQFHLLAFCILTASYLCAWAFPGLVGIPQALSILAFLGFATGFLVWCWPFAIKVWAHTVGKTVIIVMHAFVLLLATIFARFVVSSSLELPAQDFDLTVSFLVLVLYIPTWLLVVSCILGVTALVLQVIGLRSGVVRRPIGKTATIFAHMLGALVICFFLANAFDFVWKNEKALHPLVKWIAFVSDFQPAPAYPGIRAGERIRLHENGVISFAEMQGFEIKIVVRKDKH